MWSGRVIRPSRSSRSRWPRGRLRSSAQETNHRWLSFRHYFNLWPRSYSVPANANWHFHQCWHKLDCLQISPDEKEYAETIGVLRKDKQTSRRRWLLSAMNYDGVACFVFVSLLKAPVLFPRGRYTNDAWRFIWVVPHLATPSIRK